MSLENFYYDILHLKPFVLSEEDLIVQIESIIQKQMKEIQKVSKTVEGLCKVASYNIGENLKQAGLDVHYINTKHLLGCFEHVAIIVNYKIEDSIHYILIDPTFRQFVANKTAKINPAFSKWPGTVLETSNSKLYKNLMTNGYSKITQKDFEDYLKSFSSEVLYEKSELFDILLQDNKRR